MEIKGHVLVMNRSYSVTPFESENAFTLLTSAWQGLSRVKRAGRGAVATTEIT